ncbi:MAG: GNAT family N-acetyltransferase, partial [Oceanicola sp.]|nr:GNAT family N-acetyltransferase [Oceanicola sp.]
VTHIETLVSYVDPRNERSSRLAERLGATLDAEAPRPDPLDLVYRHYG